MKLPEKIKGRNRIRDGAIVLLFKRDNLDFSELSEKFNLTERRIMQILSTNHAFIRRDPEWEKEKRINRLNRWLKKDGKLRDSNKDPVEIQDFIRKEIEGDKPLIDQSVHNHYTLIQKLHERKTEPANLRVD